MASTSISLPAHEAVQVLVSSLADDSPLVRKSSISALKEIATLDPLLVLRCCSAVSRGGRRRFGNMAGVFQVMACAVRAINTEDVDPALMEKLTKIATSEMITSKELNADWQRAASGLLVSIGAHVPDLMMGEIFLHLSGPNASIPAMVQILSDFASSEALQFTPRLKEVLLRILPILGNVRHNHKPIFANAFRSWCEAVWQYRADLHCDPLLDTDVMSFLNSAFELLLGSWASSRDMKVRLSSVEALGQMVGLITRNQLKAALSRLVPTILSLFGKDQENAFISICSLQNLLNACLLSESGPPLLDFEDLMNVLHTLLPIACINTKASENSDFPIGLKTYNEVQHCFLVIGSVYPEDLLVFLLNRCQSKDEFSIVGALCVLKHLLPRLYEGWHSKRLFLIDVIKSLLDEKSFNVRMALSELLVVMASYCYITVPSGELFVEYLVRHCALPDDEMNHLKVSKGGVQWSGSFQPFHYKKLEVKIGCVSPEELREVCEKGLLLLTVTIPEMEHILWPFILRMIIPRKYTGAVSTVCKCISELSKHISFHADSLVACDDIPKPVELFARLVVLLHDPLARDQLSTRILSVLCQLGPLFPKNIGLFWQDEVPKMKAYVSDPEDLKQGSSYLEAWDDMIINFLAESLDVVRDADWIISLGDAFSAQYGLYAPADGHSALLHRCIGILLQKVNDRVYVREKIDWMYKHADISAPTNRLGLAKGMGLVAASHLDTVLDKLKNILDGVSHSMFRRFFSLFYGTQAEEADDIHAALALMYGYAARYAPSTVIEARIDALVGTNMLTRLLHVQHPIAKQAVITAIDLLGLAVINAAESGISFPLKRRDQMLEYVLTLMGRDESDLVDSNVDYLHTQNVALSACTTLVSLEPKLPMETRNHVMKATLGFFALPNNPADVLDPIIDNLITLLCAMLLTSGEDGRSRSEQLLHILRQVDQYVSSPVEHQRRRGCLSVFELLSKFRAICSGGHYNLGCQSSCANNTQIEKALKRNFTNLPSAFVLPSRDSLSLGERVITYLPRCADTSSEVRKVAVQIIGLFFSISLSLPKLVGSKSNSDIDLEVSYSALCSLEDVISILRRDASIDQSEIFNRVISSVCALLTKNELVISLHASNGAICDKIKQSSEGAIQAVTEFISKRGNELNEAEVSKTTESLLSATMSVTDKHSRQEVLNAISGLAENTNSYVVFNDILAAAARDIVTKDISRFRGGWPIQDAFHAFSQHPVLSSMFLEHVINVLNQMPAQGKTVKSEGSNQTVDFSGGDDKSQAAIAALTALFRGGGKTGRKSVEHSYANVLSSLILQLGSCHGLARSGSPEPLRNLLSAFRSFCECVGDLEMGKILGRYGEQNDGDKWINLVGELAGCISIKRPKEVAPICTILNKALDQCQMFQREAAAAALSEFILYSNGLVSVLEQIVEAMCLHVSDESPAVRSLCLKGLVQIPDSHMLQYITQCLGVIVALLEDPDESVQLTAVQCSMTVLEASYKDAVDHVLQNISLRLRNLQISLNVDMRSNAFAAYGLLSKYGTGAQLETFLEQVHVNLPRLVFHVHDEDTSVRQACRNTLRRLASLTGVDSFSGLFNTQCFSSDHRIDYEDFVRDLTRQLSLNFAYRADTYLASAIQAFDAPWPVIQANAVYFSSCLLSLLDDQRSLAPCFSQVFGSLVGKMSRSSDTVVRATCSFALGTLLRASNPQNWAAPPVDRIESARRSDS